MTDTDRRKQPAESTAKRTGWSADLGVVTQPPDRSSLRRKSRGTRLGVALGVLALAGGLAACGDGTNEAAGRPSSSPSSPAAASAGPSSAAEPSPSDAPVDLRQVTCEYRKDDSGSPAKFVGYPPKKLSAAVIKAKTMTVRTNLGDIVIDLMTEQAPCSVNSFAFLARKNFFDNTVCHRLTTMETNGLGLLQCGDPQAKGDGRNPTDGQGGPGYLFPDENLGIPFTRGVVFLAQAPDAANSNGSQFVISYTDENTALPPEYTVIGTVGKGMDIIDKIVKGGVKLAPDQVDITGDGGSNAPKTRVLIKDVLVR